MAEPKCPKCDGTTFELKEHQPQESRFKLMFVQCAECGAVVGAMDFFNVGHLLYKHGEALKKIAEKMDLAVELDP